MVISGIVVVDIGVIVVVAVEVLREGGVGGEIEVASFIV